MRTDWRDDPSIFDSIDGIEVDENGNITDIEKRPRGILSHTDREYLCGLREYEHVQSEANRKQEIRERIANSFLDFRLLVRLHDDDEQYEALRNELGVENLYRSFESLVAYVFKLGLFHQVGTLEKLIERGVYIGVNTGESEPLAGKAADVETTININYQPHVERLVQQLEDGEVEQFTPAEIGVLAQEGKLDADDLETIENTGAKSPFDSSAGISKEDPDVTDTDGNK